MSLRKTIQDREYDKFDVNADGQTAVRVLLSDAAGGFVPPGYDSVFVTYPSSTEEVYDFQKDGSTIGTVTVTYSDSSKVNLVSAVRS